MSSKISKALLSIGLASSLALVGCSSSDSDTNTDGATTVEFWHSASGASAEIIRTLIADFNSTNTSGITVEEVYQGSYQDAIASLTNAVGTTELPDVMQVTDTSTGFMYDSGLITPVEDLLEDSSFVEDLVPIIGAYYTYDDKLQAMPFQASMPMVYANKTLLEQAGLPTTEGPKTVEELTTWAQTIKDETDTAGLTVGLNSYWLEVLTASAGELYCTPDNGLGGEPATGVNYSSASQVAQWTNMQEIFESGAFLNVGQEGSEAQNAMGSRTSAMMLGSSGNLGNVSGMLGDELVVFPFPIDSTDGGTAPSGNALWVIGQDKSDEEQAAAAEFAAFMGSADSQVQSFTETGYLPNSVSAVTDSRTNASEAGKVILDQLESTQGNDITGGCHTGAMAQLRSDAAQPAVERIAAGADVETTLKEAETTGAEVIANYSERSGR